MQLKNKDRLKGVRMSVPLGSGKVDVIHKYKSFDFVSLCLSCTYHRSHGSGMKNVEKWWNFCELCTNFMNDVILPNVTSRVIDPPMTSRLSEYSPTSCSNSEISSSRTDMVATRLCRLSLAYVLFFSLRRSCFSLTTWEKKLLLLQLL
jgi:hypothetical protein